MLERKLSDACVRILIANILRKLIVDVLSGFGQPRSEFEKQLIEISRMILVGSGALVTVGAKTAARLSPERPYPVFMTPEEALDYAQAELAKR